MHFPLIVFSLLKTNCHKYVSWMTQKLLFSPVSLSQSLAFSQGPLPLELCILDLTLCFYSQSIEPWYPWGWFSF